MPLVANANLLAGRISWHYDEETTGFADLTQEGDVGAIYRVGDAYNHVFHGRYSITAAGTQTVDFYTPYLSLSKETVQASRIIGALISVTGSGGILKVEPGTSNPLNWPFPAADSETLTPGSNGAGTIWADGSGAAITSTACTWKLTNTGASTIVVMLAAFVTATEYWDWMLDFSKYYNSMYFPVVL